ncbi:anti-sigma factor antagonist [Fibrobacterota bacterium]
MTRLITTLLTSPDVSKQVRGIREAEKSHAFTLIPQIVKLSRSPNPKVAELARAAALEISQKCLLSKGKPLSQAVTSEAAQAIRKLDPDFVQNLHEQIENRDTQTAVRAMMLLKFFITDKQASDILRKTLRNPESKIRATAVLHFGTPAARVNAEILSRFLEDGDNRVKANAIEVLGRLKNNVFVRVLNRYRDHENNRIRSNALIALYHAGEYNVKKDFEFMLMEPNALMRASAVWALGELGTEGPHFLRLLKIVQNDPSEIVRNNLLIVLKKVGKIPELEFLRIALKEDIRKQLRDNIISKKDLGIERNQTGNYLELILKGVITTQSVLALKFLLDGLIKTENRFVLNFRDVEFIDSSGIGLLVNVNKNLEKKDGFLFLVHCNYRVSELLQVSGLHSVLHVFHTLEEIDQFLEVPPRN